jgi:capsular polysaccharide biosynthesis protein
VKTLLVGALAASMLVAVVVTGVSATRPPTYEASALVMVSQKEQSDGNIHPIPNANAPAPEGRQALIQTMIIGINTRPVAEEVIQRLGLDISPDELLSNLTVEQVETSQFIQLSYADTDPGRAEEVVNTVGQVSSERISNTSAAANDLKATVYERAITRTSPVSPKPLRNGLLTLGVGLVLCAGTAFALPAVGTRAAGALGERPSRQGVGQAGVLGRRHRDYSIVERIKEKKLLRALERRGKLTAVEAALETSLSVEEANRILSELAHSGHLKVTVEHGKLLYSFWGHDAP